MAAANANMRFTKTNDIIFNRLCEYWSALGLEFGYTDLVFVGLVLVISI
jgi:hypothetical protein